jgi:hypothetical protein
MNCYFMVNHWATSKNRNAELPVYDSFEINVATFPKSLITKKS